MTYIEKLSVNSSDVVSETIDGEVVIVTQAQRYQTILPLRNMLTVLEQLFETPLPDWVFFALHQMPVGQKEFLRYQILPQRKRTILKSILFRTANASCLITS